MRKTNAYRILEKARVSFEYHVVSISAGLRGAQLFVPPNELLRLTNATVARLATEPAEDAA
jgi:hypothetical protein